MKAAGPAKALLVACSLLVAGAARAETLADAVRAAYDTNPTLIARRAAQRALDETYVQARSGWRPTLGLQATVTGAHEAVGTGAFAAPISSQTGALIRPGSGELLNTSSATLVASQPLYTGGRVAAAVDAAEADVFAGRQDLRAAEISTVQQVVQAYVDVRQALETVQVRLENVGVLSRQVDEIQARLDIRLATRVDVAQSRAQLASARSALSSAQAQLRSGRAAFQTLVGHPPGELAPEGGLPGMPATVDDAFTAGEAESPLLAQARYVEQASYFRIVQARAGQRPTVNATVSAGYTGPVSPLAGDNFNRAVVGGLTVSQPLYTGGLIRSLVRQAQARNAADRVTIEATRRSLVQAISQAWNSMEAAQANLVSNQQGQDSAQTAFEGMQEQNRSGLATTFDLLLQQQLYRDAQLALIQARHDLFLAQAAVLAAVGRLDAARLSGATTYDPAVNLRAVDSSSRMLLEALPAALDRIGGPIK